MEAVSKNDDAYEGDMLDDSEPDDVPFERPSTADGGSDEVNMHQSKSANQNRIKNQKFTKHYFLI